LLRIRIIAVGKHKERWVQEGCAHFEKLLARFAYIEWKIISSKESSSLSPAEIKRREAKLLEKEFQKGWNIALADAGESMDTFAFARMLETLQVKSGGRVNFIIGGAYGLDDDLLDTVDQRVSLSPLTFSHQLVRLVLLEQLYRAFTIIHGMDYHK
jgi:23S rRNA (pseudouridine1915-N3)-methyltransferase